MEFSKLENIMNEMGISSLAEIARTLNTSPQAVSNWKSRDQVPYHIIDTLNKIKQTRYPSLNKSSYQNQSTNFNSELAPQLSEQSFFLSRFLLVIAQQLKVIVLVVFLFTFSTYTYEKYLKKPLYMSQATILLPSNNPNSNMGGLLGLASQFGVNVPTVNESDLSSPSLLPELFKSRTFSEKILKNDFYTKRYEKKLPLFQILTGKINNSASETILAQATKILQSMIEFDRFSVQDFM
jgi:Bacteriophage CI repressor helix-turn-helix domain./Chain length determinant protein.